MNKKIITIDREHQRLIWHWDKLPLQILGVKLIATKYQLPIKVTMCIGGSYLYYVKVGVFFFERKSRGFLFIQNK